MVNINANARTYIVEVQISTPYSTLHDLPIRLATCSEGRVNAIVLINSGKFDGG